MLYYCGLIIGKSICVHVFVCVRVYLISAACYQDHTLLFSVGHKISSHKPRITRLFSSRCTCTNSPNYTCGNAPHGGLYCVDLNSGCQDVTNTPTSTPDLGQVFTAPDCFGTRDFIGDGYCDGDNNNEGCVYGGGDCCS